MGQRTAIVTLRPRNQRGKLKSLKPIAVATAIVVIALLGVGVSTGILPLLAARYHERAFIIARLVRSAGLTV